MWFEVQHGLFFWAGVQTSAILQTYCMILFNATFSGDEIVESCPPYRAQDVFLVHYVITLMSTKDWSSTAPDGKDNANPATRMSQRKRTKAIDTAARGQTRAKSAVRQPKTGQLSQLRNMPMDVLMEVRIPFLRQIRCIYSSRHVNNAQIFGHLHPLDLLHLARTTKAFRRVLMHRSAISVWKAARATIPGQPDCPPAMSEPQWANLAFGLQCHVSASERVQLLFPFTS